MHVWHDFPRHISPFAGFLNICEKAIKIEAEIERKRNHIFHMCMCAFVLRANDSCKMEK